MYKQLSAVFAGISLALLAANAHSDSYPAKPIRVVVPYSAGGSNDVVSRTITPRLSEAWKQPVIVDNRAGAGSLIGTEIVVRSPSDGYTLLATSGALAINVSLYRLSFDPLKDLAAVAFMAQMPYVLAVHPSVPVNSTRDLINYAKANPGKLSFASAGTATSTHLTGEMFKSMAKVDLLHVPYKGGGPALNAIISNEVQVVFNVVSGAMPHVRNGRLRALAVSSAKRADAAPELPTIDESGVPGFDVVSGYTMYAPAGTPRAIINKINSAINKVLREPEMKERYLTLGVTPIISTPESLTAYLKSEISRWEKIIKKLELKP